MSDLFYNATQVGIVLMGSISVSVEMLQHVVLSELLDEREFTSSKLNQSLADENQDVEIIIELSHPRFTHQQRFDRSRA